MTAPTPSHAVCWYDGTDSQAAILSNDDGTYKSLCNCGTVCCESGTFDEAANALEAHRAETADETG